GLPAMIAIVFLLAVTLGLDTPVDFLSQASVDGIRQIADVIFDIGDLNVFSSKISGVDNLQKIVCDLYDRTLAGQRSRSKMLEFRLQISERVQEIASNLADLVPLFQVFVHFTPASFPIASEPQP